MMIIYCRKRSQQKVTLHISGLLASNTFNKANLLSNVQKSEGSPAQIFCRSFKKMNLDLFIHGLTLLINVILLLHKHIRIVYASLPLHLHSLYH
jgi:hypothetical protein